MKILFFGGGRQLGISIRKKILETNDSITIVNRGLSSKFEESDFFGEKISYIKSSKKNFFVASDLNMYDLIIDTCAYADDDFYGAKEKLLSFKGIYVLISSVFVYKNSQQIIDENSSLNDDGAWQKDKVNAAYISGKINCEKLITSLVGKTLVIRSGVLLGPHDHTGRLHFWLDKIKKTEPIPQLENAYLQILNPDNLINFILSCAGRGISGIYNTCGTVLRYEDFLRVLSTEMDLNYPKLSSIEKELFLNPPFFEVNNENIYSTTKAEEMGFISNDSELLLQHLMRECYQ